MTLHVVDIELHSSSAQESFRCSATRTHLKSNRTAADNTEVQIRDMTRRARHWPLDVKIWLLTVTVALLCVPAVLPSAGSGLFVGGRWGTASFVALLGLFALAEVFSVHLHFTKNSHSVSLFEIPLTLGLFFAPIWGLLAAHIVGAFLALALHRHQKPLKLAFNLALLALGDVLAVLVFRQLAGAAGEFSVRSMAAAGPGC
jgi:uncharacterized integral membrane protein